MFHLISALYSQCRRIPTVNVLVVGLDSAGKTTLSTQIAHLYQNTPSPSQTKIIPTIGLNLSNVNIKDVNVNFWDLGGQSGLRSLWDKYFLDAHAVLFVIDARRAERMGEISTELKALIDNKMLTDAPIAIIANKIDKLKDEGEGGGERTEGKTQNADGKDSLKDSISITMPMDSSPSLLDESSLRRLLSLDSFSSDGRPLSVFPVSALEGVGVIRAVEWIVTQINKSKRTKRMILERQGGGNGELEEE